MKIEYLGQSESDGVQKWKGGRGGNNKMTGIMNKEYITSDKEWRST
jgi:hypothetical protein